MPQEIRYPYGGHGSTYHYTYSPYAGGPLGVQPRPAVPDAAALPGGPASTREPSTSDIHNNRYHGFQSMLTPDGHRPDAPSPPQIIAVMGAMPYDWDLTLDTATPATSPPAIRRRHRPGPPRRRR